MKLFSSATLIALATPWFAFCQAAKEPVPAKWLQNTRLVVPELGFSIALPSVDSRCSYAQIPEIEGNKATSFVIETPAFGNYVIGVWETSGQVNFDNGIKAADKRRFIERMQQRLPKGWRVRDIHFESTNVPMSDSLKFKATLYYPEQPAAYAYGYIASPKNTYTFFGYSRETIEPPELRKFVASFSLLAANVAEHQLAAANSSQNANDAKVGVAPKTPSSTIVFFDTPRGLHRTDSSDYSSLSPIGITAERFRIIIMTIAEESQADPSSIVDALIHESASADQATVTARGELSVEAISAEYSMTSRDALFTSAHGQLYRLYMVIANRGSVAFIICTTPTEGEMRDRRRQIEELIHSVRFAPQANASAIPINRAGPSTEEIVRKAMPAIVIISTPDGWGSGFFVSSQGVIVTNEHVIGSHESVAVMLFDGRVLETSTIFVDRDKDLALLRIPGSGYAFLPLAPELPSPGADVIAIGSPGIGDVALTNTVTKGIVSAVRRIGDETWIQTDASINRGNSGGPLLNSRGQVVGVNTLATRKSQYSGLNFSISSSELDELIRTRLGVELRDSSSH